MRFSTKWSMLLLPLLFAACSDIAEPPAEGRDPSTTRAADTHATRVVVSDTFSGHRYIIRLTQDVGDVQSVAQQIARAHGGNVIHSYKSVFKGFAAAFPNRAAAEALRSNPAVVSVEEDAVLTVKAAQYNPSWGLDRVDQRSNGLDGVFNYFHTGAGANVYVLDTGIYGGHSEFSGRQGTTSATYVYPYNAWSDCNGHGTAVASIAAGTTYGVAKGATLHPIQAFGCDGNGLTSDVVAGIEFVINYGAMPAVINMSLGSAANTTVDDAVRAAMNDWITVVTAAGNSNTDACTESPARVSGAITVGATTASDYRHPESNYGSCVDLFAPGYNIDAASNTGGSRLIGKTSAATAFVTGTAAQILGYRGTITPSFVADQIRGSATQGVVLDAGTGSPNRLLYSLHTYAVVSGPGSLAPEQNGTWEALRWGGDGSYTYQWQKALNSGGPFYDISGATGRTYTA